MDQEKIKIPEYQKFWASHATSPAGTLPFLRNYAGTDKDTPENRRLAYNNYKKSLRQNGKLEE